MKSNEAAEGNENACFSAHFSGKTGTSTGADNCRAVCFLPSPGEAFSRSQAGLPAWLPPQEHLPSDFFASGCTNSSAHVPLSASRLLGQRRSCTGFPCSPNTPVSDAAHRCAPVWAVHLSRILYMLTAHLSICYASLTLSRRFAIILMEETALVDFIRFLCISFRTQGASSLSKPKSSMDNPVSPVTIKIKQHGSERAEGVKGAIADFVRFHCPLVASAEAKPLRQNAQYPKMQPSPPKAISAHVRRALPNLFPHRR